MLDLACAMRDRGYEVTIACTAQAVATEATTSALDVLPIDPPARTGPLPAREEIRAWGEILDGWHPDVIHVNNTELMAPLVPCAMRRGVPLIVHQHLLDGAFARVYSFMHQAAAIVTISAEATACLTADGYPIDRLHQIPNGVRVDPNPGPADLRGMIAAPDDAVVAVSTGSLIHRKGYDRTFAALASALHQAPALHLAILGDGPDAAKLQEDADRLGVGDRVHFLGARTDVQPLLRAADMYVTAARAEVQPLSVIEAMFCGLPVVGSDIAAHAEMVDDRVTGLLADADDPKAFGNALVRAASDPAWRADASWAARQAAASRYDFEQFTGRFAELYQRLVAAPPREYGFPRALRSIPAYGRWVKEAGMRRLFG